MNELITIISAMVLTVVAGIGEALRIKNVSKYTKEWHQLQWLERVLMIAVGAYLFNNASTVRQFASAFARLLFVAIVFWIGYDGIINLYLNRGFFYVSPTSGAWTEQFAHWYIKIPLLIGIIFLNIILRRRDNG